MHQQYIVLFYVRKKKAAAVDKNRNTTLQSPVIIKPLISQLTEQKFCIPRKHNLTSDPVLKLKEIPKLVSTK